MCEQGFARRGVTSLHKCLTLCAHSHSAIAALLPLLGIAWTYVFLDNYYKLEGPVLRMVFWLGTKAAVTGMLHLWSKTVTYGATNDCQALLLMFAMVNGLML